MGEHMTQKAEDILARAEQSLARGRFAQAAEAFRELVAQAPSDLRARQRLADALARSGLFVQALREYQHVVGAYVAAGHPLKAMAVCKLIWRLDPEHRETPLALAQLLGTPRPDVGATVPLPPALAQGLASSIPGEPLAGLFWPDIDDLPEQASEELADEEPVESWVVPGALPAVPLFGSLPRETFVALLQHSTPRVVPHGGTVIREGDRGDSLFVLVEGEVDVGVRNPDASLRMIERMPEGVMFGELALMTRAPRLATILACRDSILFELTRARLAPVMVAHPAVKAVLEQFYRERMLGHLFRASPLFRALPPETQVALTPRFKVQSFGSAHDILRQGQSNDNLFFVLRGQCEVFRETPEEGYREYPLKVEGSVFGEISLLWGEPVTATVRTLTPCTLMCLPRKDFDELVRVHEKTLQELRNLGKQHLVSMGLDLPAGR